MVMITGSDRVAGVPFLSAWAHHRSCAAYFVHFSTINPKVVGTRPSHYPATIKLRLGNPDRNVIVPRVRIVTRLERIHPAELRPNAS